jgi:plastocyanin
MRPRRSAFIIAALTAIAALVAAATASAATPKLVGETGPGFTIEVKTAAGKDVKSLKAGTYVLKVEDKSSIHNFHLIGPGVNKSTSVGGTGEKTWKVTLKPGKYTYQCDIHASQGMKGTFKVVR